MIHSATCAVVLADAGQACSCDYSRAAVINRGDLALVEVWAAPGFKLLKCRVLNFTAGDNGADTLVELTATWGAYRRGEWLHVRHGRVFSRRCGTFFTSSGHVSRRPLQYWDLRFASTGDCEPVPVLIYA